VYQTSVTSQNTTFSTVIVSETQVTQHFFFAACSNILSFVWHFYVTSFAHSAIQDHVLGVVHGSLLTLPWDRFWPSVQDLEYMLKVQTFSCLACKM